MHIYIIYISQKNIRKAAFSALLSQREIDYVIIRKFKQRNKRNKYRDNNVTLFN